MPKIRTAKQVVHADVIEMALGGGACSWTEADMQAFKRYTEQWPNQQLGLKEWLRFEREHEEFMQQFIRRERAENQKG